MSSNPSGPKPVTLEIDGANFTAQTTASLSLGAKTINAPSRPIWPIVAASAISAGPDWPGARIARHNSQALPRSEICISQ